MFYASVSSYKYICAKFITALMIHDRGSIIVEEQEIEKAYVYVVFLYYTVFCAHVAFVSF